MVGSERDTRGLRLLPPSGPDVGLFYSFPKPVSLTCRFYITYPRVRIDRDSRYPKLFVGMTIEDMFQSVPKKSPRVLKGVSDLKEGISTQKRGVYLKISLVFSDTGLSRTLRFGRKGPLSSRGSESRFLLRRVSGTSGLQGGGVVRSFNHPWVSTVGLRVGQNQGTCRGEVLPPYPGLDYGKGGPPTKSFFEGAPGTV